LSYYPKLPICNFDLSNAKLVRETNTSKVIMLYKKYQEQVQCEVNEIQDSGFPYFVEFTYWNKQSKQIIRIQPFTVQYKSGYTNKLGKDINNFCSFNDEPSLVNDEICFWHKNGLEHRDGDKFSSFQHSIGKYQIYEYSYKKRGMLCREDANPAYTKVEIQKSLTKDVYYVNVYYKFGYCNFATFYFLMFYTDYPEHDYVYYNKNGKRKLFSRYRKVNYYLNNLQNELYFLCLVSLNLHQNCFPPELVVLSMNFLFPECPKCLMYKLVHLMLESMYKIKNRIT
jgi:hypothetical protein